MVDLRAAVKKRGNRVRAFALLGFACAALLLGHSAIGMEHGTEKGEHAMQDVVSVCLAVTAIAGAFALLVGAPRLHRRRRRRRAGIPPALNLAGAVQPAPSARAGPAALQVFRL